MPLRTVEHVAFLRRKYEEIVLNGAAPEDRLFLHLEGHGGEYPGLFAPTMEEVRNRGRGALLAAVALGLLVEQTDARTGNAHSPLQKRTNRRACSGNSLWRKPDCSLRRS